MITIREDAPENLRYFVLETALRLELRPGTLRDIACSLLHVRPDPGNWSEYPNIWDEAQRLIYGCDWFHVYDFIEQVHRALDRKREQEGTNHTVDFENALNDFFVEQGIGWQLAKGEILSRGSEAFEAAVNEASTALGAAGRTTARGEIHEALADLSRRPEPDLTGAIQHGMAALECVARDVCGNPKLTLGDILKKSPELLPKPLDVVVEKAWGYASEMGRHLREGRKPERKDVELVVSLAASLSTYLSR